MPLKSKLFTEDPMARSRLEACLVSHPAHVFFGQRGEHVARIQRALMIIGASAIDQSELLGKLYGHSTVLAVRRYKQNHKPPIINTCYEKTVDDIVGKMTIGYLDEDYFEFEIRPHPQPSPIPEFYVSMTPYGSPHDHSRCPPNNPGGLEPVNGRVNHLGTPVSPKGTGRKINIGGEGETKYLGFEDVIFYFNDPQEWQGRPFITSIPDHTVSDMCFRSAPISHYGSQDRAIEQMKRVAIPGCRLTFAVGNEKDQSAVRKLGKVIVETYVQGWGGDEADVLVVEMF